VVGAVIVSSLKLGNAFTLHYVEVPLASVLQVVFLLIITIISLRISDPAIRKDNGFNWEPINEVTKLFATIFMTMVTPIAMLRAGADGPVGMVIKGVMDDKGEFINSHFFWATGVLSSFLDNAPTYLVFFNTAGGDPVDLMGVHAGTLLAISAGAVFMGANTYIGNAPNFMTKAIAEESGVPMPSFFGFLFKYSIPILTPVFILVTYIFF
jgi:Na+/H+ antiporter NhaD/arsenite permease-like protein